MERATQSQRSKAAWVLFQGGPEANSQSCSCHEEVTPGREASALGHLCFVATERTDIEGFIIVKVIHDAHEVSLQRSVQPRQQMKIGVHMLGMSIYRAEQFDFGPCHLLRGIQAYRY